MSVCNIGSKLIPLMVTQTCFLTHDSNVLGLDSLHSMANHLETIVVPVDFNHILLHF